MRTFVTAVAIFLMAGCSLNKTFVKAVDGYTQVILPEYKTYVDQDTTLSDETKSIRKQTADKFQQLVEEAK